MAQSWRNDHPRLDLQDLPEGSWDTHCHTFDPTLHPYEVDSPYIPPPSSVDQLISAVPCSNFCIVMAMPEGTRPEMALESVARLTSMPGRTARATIVMDPDAVTNEELHRLAAKGVRSVRIHAKGAITKHLSGDEALINYITRISERIAPLGWSVDGQLRTHQWVQLAPTLRQLHERLGTIFVADHCFYLRPEDVGTAAWDTCISLINDGVVYVKISGLDRNVENNDLAPMEPVVKGLAGAHGGDRNLFGSDWPHVIPGDFAQNVLPIDSSHELAYHRLWLGEEGFRKLMVDNPQRLYQ